jgi:tRNA-specific adenosine deaminase 3
MSFFKEPITRSSPWFIEKIEVRESSIHGLGVFAKELIEKNEMFESCPVLIFSQFTMTHLYESAQSRSLLHDYVFSWFEGQVAVALGCGSIYNHSNDDTNASHRMNSNIPSIEFVAKRDIQPDEEILIHYWKGKCRGEFTDSGTMVADGRITEKMKIDGIASYRKKRRRR